MANEKPARPGNRKEFVRTRVPAAELAAGAVILLLLAGIGVAIAIKAGGLIPTSTPSAPIR